MDRARIAIDKGIALDPTNPIVIQNDAFFLYLNRDPRFFDRARAAVSANPRDGPALANMGFRIAMAGEWAEKSMRRNPGTPWSKDPIRQKVRNFETVINAFYPTVTDLRLQGAMRALLRSLSGWRYRLEFYAAPYELKVLQRLIHYRRPETSGF